MSLRVMGGAGSIHPLVDSVTVSATSISNGILVSNKPPVAASKAIPTIIVTPTTTSYRDISAFGIVAIKRYISPGQSEALRSATTNTALAFSLPVGISADRATLLQKQISEELPPMQPIYDSVIIPS